MFAETAGAMMILAVDVGGDHASDGDQLRAWDDGREKSAWKILRDDVGE
jgi:hypothetical protein